MDELLIKMIHEYEKTAAELLGSLKSELKVTNPVRSVVEKTIPRHGQLSNHVEYTTHGVGIRFEQEEAEILDVDLDADGNYVGFDVWRLSSFADGKETYKNLDREAITKTVERMFQDQKIEKCEDPMVSHLYTWKKRNPSIFSLKQVKIRG